MFHIYLAGLIYFGFSSSQLAPKSHDIRILDFADLRKWTEAGWVWVQHFISVWLCYPLLVHSDLVSDEICASLSKMTFRWEKTLAQVEKAAKLLNKDVLGTTWLLTGWVYHWSVCNARCLTVHTVCTVHWRCELKVARCELRGWTETRGAAGTTDTFILSSSGWPNRHNHDAAVKYPCFL